MEMGVEIGTTGPDFSRGPELRVSGLDLGPTIHGPTCCTYAQYLDSPLLRLLRRHPRACKHLETRICAPRSHLPGGMPSACWRMSFTWSSTKGAARLIQ